MAQNRITLVMTKPKLADSPSVQTKQSYDSILNNESFNSLYFPIFKLSTRPESNEPLKDFAFSTSGDKQKIIVFVSPSALEFGLSVLGDWPEGLICAVMGAQSANLARKWRVPEHAIVAPGFSDHSVSEDSDGLHDILIRRFAPSSCAILICKGPLGRTSFNEKLIEAGYQVSQIETYNRDVAIHSSDEIDELLSLNTHAVVWLTSGESVKTLNQVIQDYDHQKAEVFKQSAQVLVTHPRILTTAQECGFAKVTQIKTGLQSVNEWIVNFLAKNALETKSAALLPDQTKQIPATPMTENAYPNSPPTKNPVLPVVLACLAILSVVALAFVGQNRLEQTKQVVGERLQSEKTRVKILEEKLDKTEGLYRDLKAKFDLLDAAQKEAAGQQATLEAVYKDLVASRSAVSLSEIEQLISIAKRQLFVLGNLDGAKVALRQAVQLLENAEQPSLISLRTNIEKDLAELNAVKEVNLLALALELDSIIDSVDTMPTLAGAEASKDMTLAELTHGGPGMERIDPVQHNPNIVQATFGAIGDFILAIWEDIKSLVEITKVDNPEVLQISAKQQTDLRNTLRLSILNARLSLLSRHSELLKSDINRSRAITSIYFDQKNAQVQRTLKVLEKVGQSQLDISLPDLVNSTSSLNLAKAAEGGTD